jgi:uncharacterized membrane protein YphA (DoxX/SURF4 family)
MAERGLGPATGLRALSILLGIFMLFMGINKVGWLTDTSVLESRFTEWRDAGPPAARWYLETFAIPGTPIFARVVPLAEIAAGLAMIAGFWTRLAAALALFMVLNFHFASDVLLHYAYLTNGYGLPVLSGLLALTIGGKNLPWSLSK